MACDNGSAAAQTSYATLEDLDESGLPLSAIDSVPHTIKQKLLLRASRFADSYLRNRYTLPIACPYDEALKHAVVQIASWWIMTRRGFNAQMPGDEVIRMGYNDAVKWLTAVSNGQIALCVTQATPESDQPNLYSNIRRGYGDPNVGTSPPILSPDTWGV